MSEPDPHAGSARRPALRRRLGDARQATLAYLGRLNADEWQTAVYADEAVWTVADLLRHLTDAEKGMTGLIKRIRDGGEGVPPDFDLTRWNARVVARRQAMSPAELLAEMAENRQNLLDLMATLAERDWDKQGRHGSLQIMTIEEICLRIAHHEETHLADIRQTLDNNDQ